MVSKTARVACVQTFPASSKTGVSSVRVADYCWFAFVFWSGHCSRSFRSFVLIMSFGDRTSLEHQHQNKTTKKTEKDATVVPCLMMYMTKSKAGKAGTGLACVTDGSTDLVKSVCETVSKSLFWAPTCVPGFEYALWLASLKCYWKFAIEGKTRKAFPVIRWVRWGARTRISALLRRSYQPGLDYVCDAR